ncbi:MAG: nucleotidyltransferase family protein [Candidatus Omnitrophica bacterium]|nr:nucleotidyltransferase family protein [Candidatus Omnitrophota bacterium]
MLKPSISNEEKFLLLCSQLTPDRRVEQEITALLNGPINWKKIMETANRHGVSLFLYAALTKLGNQDSCPPQIYGHLKSSFYASVNRMIRLEQETLRIQEAALREHIAFIPFKGLALAHTVYPNPALRAMDDVDILVKEDQFSAFVTLLNQMGYAPPLNELDPVNPTAPLTRISADNFGISIDVHRALVPDRPIKISLPIWKRAKEISVDHQKMLALSEEDTFLSLALHLRRHLRRLTLKFIVDIAELLKKAGAGLDWEYIKEHSKNNHICRTVYLALYLSKDLLDAPIPDKIYQELEPCPAIKYLLHRAISRHNIFTLKKRNGTILRVLLFDRLGDLLLYLWRVSFLERCLKKPSPNRNIKTPPSATDKETKR